MGMQPDAGRALRLRAAARPQQGKARTCSAAASCCSCRWSAADSDGMQLFFDWLPWSRSTSACSSCIARGHVERRRACALARARTASSCTHAASSGTHWSDICCCSIAPRPCAPTTCTHNQRASGTDLQVGDPAPDALPVAGRHRLDQLLLVHLVLVSGGEPQWLRLVCRPCMPRLLLNLRLHLRWLRRLLLTWRRLGQRIWGRQWCRQEPQARAPQQLRTGCFVRAHDAVEKPEQRLVVVGSQVGCCNWDPHAHRLAAGSQGRTVQAAALQAARRA